MQNSRLIFLVHTCAVFIFTLNVSKTLRKSRCECTAPVSEWQLLPRAFTDTAITEWAVCLCVYGLNCAYSGVIDTAITYKLFINVNNNDIGEQTGGTDGLTLFLIGCWKRVAVDRNSRVRILLGPLKRRLTSPLRPKKKHEFVHSYVIASGIFISVLFEVLLHCVKSAW